MRRTLGTSLLLLALAGCGSGSGSGSGSEGADAEPTVTQVALLSGTAAGGEVTTEPTPLPDAAAAAEYAAQFDNADLEHAIVTTAEQTEVPDGRQLAAAVVAVGCEEATKVTGSGTGDDVVLEATVPTSTAECFAPVTTVGMVLIPA